jgi:Transposase IS4
MDEYNSDPRSPYHTTVANDYIKFHDPNDIDPDWIVRQCYLLLIAAVWEGDVGNESLWKKGQSGGRHSYADFGQYVPLNYFKVFQSSCPYMFVNKSLWYEERRNLTWDMFLPVLQQFNEKRKNTLECSMLMLDESMSGWRPKTLKFGGLPNITFEPRKPVPLGTQFRNAAECFTGCLMFQDIVQTSEEQKRKKYFFVNQDAERGEIEMSHLPGKHKMQAHVAEVLRQVEGAGVVEGGWVGGDAWFGSVMTCVEVMKRHKVHSTFVVKNHHLMFPMGVLHSVLEARHGNRPAGHWVTMTATISGVPIIAMAYAWSQKGVSYFVSTCGNTEVSQVKYESKFEDEWGNTQYKELDRPQLAHFLYEYLPLIDEHNKQRQAILALETRWLTRDPWFRLICTTLGMSVVDMHRLFRHYELKVHNKSNKDVDYVTIVRFSDLICGNLRQWTYQYKRRALLQGVAEHPLTRITDEQGNTVRQPTARQIANGKNVGNPIVLMCFICRRYKIKGATVQQQTSWWCRQCHMPICHVARNSEGSRRVLTCLEEHQQSDDQVLGCFKSHIRGSNVPEHLIVKLEVRNNRSKRRKQG